MDFDLFGAKTLSEEIVATCYLEPCKQSAVKYESEHDNTYWNECIWKCSICETAAIYIYIYMYIKLIC